MKQLMEYSLNCGTWKKIQNDKAQNGKDFSKLGFVDVYSY